MFNYNRNIYNQETYQILIYIIEFDINILSKENCLSLINENSDDFSLCLLTVIYLKYKWNIIELLQKIDELFLDATTFINGKGKMSQDYWFLDTFYYLRNKNIITKKRLITTVSKVITHVIKQGLQNRIKLEICQRQ